MWKWIERVAAVIAVVVAVITGGLLAWFTRYTGVVIVLGSIGIATLVTTVLIWVNVRKLLKMEEEREAKERLEAVEVEKVGRFRFGRLIDVRRPLNFLTKLFRRDNREGGHEGRKAAD